MPEDWLLKWGEKSPVGLPHYTRDDADDYPPVERIAQIEERNRRTAGELLEKVLPRIR
jgi:hypothetical protein